MFLFGRKPSVPFLQDRVFLCRFRCVLSTTPASNHYHHQQYHQHHQHHQYSHHNYHNVHGNTSVFLFIVCRGPHLYISIIINNININTITMITIVQTSLYSSSNPAVRLTIRTTPTIAAIVTAERRTAR